MEAIVLTALSAIVTDAFGYWAHRALHSPLMGPLHRMHTVHHDVLYPPDDFSSDEYRKAGKNDTAFSFLLLGSPLVVLPVAAATLGLVGWTSAACSLATIGAVGMANDRIHEWVHLRSHPFHRIPWARRLVNMHRAHHEDVRMNFGIFTFLWDRIAGTLKETK